MGISALRRRLLAILLGGVVLQTASAQTASDHAEGHHHSDGDLVFFVHAEAHHYSNAASQPTPDLNEDAALASDIVLALARGKFRLFGEYLVTNEEHDLERLQVGYEPVGGTVVWFGRYHQPASAWNTEHHHGRYLQTSVTRPAIELWEDEHGLLPQHLTGLLVDSRVPVGDAAGLQASLGVGLGALIDDEGLNPFDLLDTQRQGRRASWTGRLAYLPDYFGASQFGLIGAAHSIPIVDAGTAGILGASQVRQYVIGAFVDWRYEGWRTLGAIYDVRIGYDGSSGSRAERFASGYLQVERQLPGDLTAYGRAENSDGAASSTYVSLTHSDFVLRRALLGLRWDLRPRQALTFEAGRGTTSLGPRHEVRLQWSAAFP